MTTPRPFSRWVARILPDETQLGPVNYGDRRSDARYLELFTTGWQRHLAGWSGRTVLALRRTRDDQTVAELDEHGVPISTGPDALDVIGRLEDSWPRTGLELLTLDREPLALRYWVLARLDAEGDPPDQVFSLLPWDLVDRTVDSLCSALAPGGAIGELVEMRHWLTPAVRGLTGPLEQLDHGLRTNRPRIARDGATTLLANLRDLPVSRIPAHTRDRLITLVDLLGQTDRDHRDIAGLVHARLAVVTPAVPDDLSRAGFAEVLAAGFLGEHDPTPERRPARLVFDGESTSLLGPEVTGRLSRRDTELIITLTSATAQPGTVTVATDEPGAVPVPLTAVGSNLRARLPWSAPDLPDRLIFRAVTR